MLLAGGGLALAAAGVAVAASMHPDTSCCAPPRGEQFQNEIIRAGTVRDFVITSNGTGTLNARLSWVPARVVLGMHIAALSDAQQVLAEGIESGPSERSLSLPVTARAYRISVTRNSGQGAREDASFTLLVGHS